MSALITNIIPPAGYMLVRDAIGAILLLELTNQKTLQGLPEQIEVYRERVITIQADENLYLNVLADSSTNSGFTARDRQGLTTFFIDVYTTGIADPDNALTGDLDSAQRLHSYMNMCMYILSSNLYPTLGLDGIVSGKYVTSFATAEPQQFENSNYSRMGRITYQVRINETTAPATPELLGGNDTIVKLQLTAHGYQYVFENSP